MTSLVVEGEKQHRIWTRLTRSSETSEGLQQSSIHVYIYDNEDIAYTYFEEAGLTISKWEEALREGECFFDKVYPDHINTFLLEIKTIIC